MVITEELAQKIVGTVMPVVHRNVNIMNRAGIILGTGHPERRGTLHKGALDAVLSGASVEIYPDEVCRYPGAKQGVNLPVFLEGEIVGVVGVFGIPDEVRDTANMLKLVTELILEQELSTAELHERSKLQEEFVESALFHTGLEVPPKVRRLARTLGFNLESTRCICVFDVSSFREDVLSGYGSSGLLDERLNELVTKALRNEGLLQEQELIVLREEKMIVLPEFAPEDHPQDAITLWLRKAQKRLSDVCNRAVTCAAGSIALSAAELPASHAQAQFCLACCTPKNPCRSIFERGLLVRYLASHASTGGAATALRINHCRFEIATREMAYVRETLAALLANNLDAGKTAGKLGIHRNTLAYRLQRIRDEIGLDPLYRADDVFLAHTLLEKTKP